jgi:hypothetical protein
VISSQTTRFWLNRKTASVLLFNSATKEPPMQSGRT